MDEFFAWVDQHRKDIEAHSDWIDEQYTQFEDYIIHPELKDFKDYEILYPSAVKGQWEDVLQICRKEMFLSTVPITNSWDTVFHLAISDDRNEYFEKLLQLLPQESTHIASALRRKNNKGNNPLHIAASVGSVMMCRLIIRISKSMISTCNNEGETPLFVAALKGNKEAFLYLNSECGSKEKYCIRRNGDTILHCAIAEEHYGVPEMFIKKVRETKVRHGYYILIMNELLKNTSMYRFSQGIDYPVIPQHAESQNDDELIPLYKKLGKGKEKEKAASDQSKETSVQDSAKKKKKRSEQKDIDLSELTPILVAAKNGITEMVKATLKRYPMAMYDVDKNEKNIVLLTAEHKQPCVYELLLSLKEKKIIKESIFGEVDKEGNSALHLAAKSTDFRWPVPGALSQMQWEIKWYEYIKKSLWKRSFHFLHNNNSQTPEEVFTKKHQNLVKLGGSWLISTSNACSVVAGLFVTSTFSTATNVPEGFESKVNKSSKIYACSSFVSFYSSLIAVVMFLAIPTSWCREKDFRHALPLKLLLGLTAFYISIASTLVSFTTGHFFIFRNQLKFVSSTSYIVTNVLVTVSSMAVFPLYFHLVWATFKKVPQRKYRVNIPRWFLED
nr:uncharacterized protein LOC112028548 [Quercus suber]